MPSKKKFLKKNLLLAIEMSLACMLSYYIGLQTGSMFSSDLAIIGTLWCMISTILVMQSTWLESLDQAAFRMLGSVMGAVLGGACFYCFGFNWLAFWFVVVVLVLVCVFCNREKNLRLALLTVAVIYVGSGDTHPLFVSFIRLFESLAGVLVALGVRFLTEGLHQHLDGESYHASSMQKNSQRKH